MLTRLRFSVALWLIGAVVALRDAAIPESERAAALAFSPWRNPYDDRPLRWDESDAAVVFGGLELGERGEYRFHY